MKNQSPRAKFIESVNLKKLAGHSWDAMKLASTHDPDLRQAIIETEKKLEDWVKQLWREIDILKRQMERLGAPQYRVVKKGNKAA